MNVCKEMAIHPVCVCIYYEQKCWTNWPMDWHCHFWSPVTHMAKTVLVKVRKRLWLGLQNNNVVEFRKRSGPWLNKRTTNAGSKRKANIRHWCHSCPNIHSDLFPKRCSHLCFWQTTVIIHTATPGPTQKKIINIDHLRYPNKQLMLS